MSSTKSTGIIFVGKFAETSPFGTCIYGTQRRSNFSVQYFGWLYDKRNKRCALYSMVNLCQTIWPKLISFHQLYCNASAVFPFRSLSPSLAALHAHVQIENVLCTESQTHIYLMNWLHCTGSIVFLTSKSICSWN